MRLLSSIFLENSLSYKMPLRFNNLDIGGGFSLVTKTPLRFQQLYHTRTYPLLQKCQSHFQGLHMQRKHRCYKMQRCFQHHPPRFIKHHHSSQINIDQYRSIQIMHIHASSCRIVLFWICLVLFIVLRRLCNGLLEPHLSYKMPVWFFISQYEAHHVMLQKCHCGFHDGLTWLKWLLYKMIFTSLSYKILGLDFHLRVSLTKMEASV